MSDQTDTNHSYLLRVNINIEPDQQRVFVEIIICIESDILRYKIIFLKIYSLLLLLIVVVVFNCISQVYGCICRTHRTQETKG